MVLSIMSGIDLVAMSARIVEAIHPKQIILFGSRARGDDTPDSDVDLLVITTETYGLHNSRRRAMARLLLILADMPVSKDIVLFSDIEVEQWRTAKNHLVARALREGKVIYEQH
ncbi:MAG: nucleotidyltransferase domain-containing protein [Magnetococcales bacterium]|nr:nucleotidyltransferase domain-containing protein [Magnetococcales bacterium]